LTSLFEGEEYVKGAQLAWQVFWICIAIAVLWVPEVQVSPPVNDVGKGLMSIWLLLGIAAPVNARDLLVELKILEFTGPLSRAAWQTQWDSPLLDVTGIYESPKHIEGVTARKERILPLGSKWFPIPQYTVVAGNKIWKDGLRLRVLLADSHPAHKSYRLRGAYLHVPMPANIAALPQPSLEVGLADESPAKAAEERTISWRSAELTVKVHLRLTWQ